MTPVEDRLRALLQDAVPDGTGVSFDAVSHRVRRRHQVLAAGVATAVAAVVAAVAIAVVAMPSSGPDRVTTGPTPTTSVPPPSVAFQGISFALPDGWTVAQPRCGSPNDHTVVVGTWAGSCPMMPRNLAATAVTLTSLYGRQFALNWPGHRTTWQGQPAWLATEKTGRITSVTLSLPWANAFVTAQSGDATTARDLLDRVSVRKDVGLDVPVDATSVFVQSLAGHDGDGQQRNTTVTHAADVQRLLADLRALLPVTSPGQACNGSWWPSTALLTVRSGAQERTYAARFGGCALVVAGTGSAARASNQLLFDIRHLVRNSGL
jgi:hypothetical protein